MFFRDHLQSIFPTSVFPDSTYPPSHDYPSGTCSIAFPASSSSPDVRSLLGGESVFRSFTALQANILTAILLPMLLANVCPAINYCHLSFETYHEMETGNTTIISSTL